MGGEKGIVKSTLHAHLLHKKNNQGVAMKGVPKGCLAIKVGGEGEEQQRFIVPVIYFNHPLFLKLLKEAEEEYGFEHEGTITIPCHVNEFRHVQGIIDKEKSHHHHHHHNYNHHHYHTHHLAIVACFKA